MFCDLKKNTVYVRMYWRVTYTWVICILCNFLRWFQKCGRIGGIFPLNADSDAASDAHRNGAFQNCVISRKLREKCFPGPVFHADFEFAAQKTGTRRNSPIPMPIPPKLRSNILVTCGCSEDMKNFKSGQFFTLNSKNVSKNSYLVGICRFRCRYRKLPIGIPPRCYSFAYP